MPFGAAGLARSRVGYALFSGFQASKGPDTSRTLYLFVCGPDGGSRSHFRLAAGREGHDPNGRPFYLPSLRLSAVSRVAHQLTANELIRIVALVIAVSPDRKV